jgi:hypothetical protein
MIYHAGWLAHMPWWFAYAVPYPFAVLIAVVLGESKWKRITGSVMLCLLVTLSMYSSLMDYERLQPIAVVRHIDPPLHWWKTPPLP